MLFAHVNCKNPRFKVGIQGRIQDLIGGGGAQIMTGLKLPFWGLSFVEFWCWGLIFGGQGGGGRAPGSPPGSAPGIVIFGCRTFSVKSIQTNLVPPAPIKVKFNTKANTYALTIIYPSVFHKLSALHKFSKFCLELWKCV